VSKVEAQAVANRASRVQKSLERETERVLSPERESVDGLITIAVKPVEELNYSLFTTAGRSSKTSSWSSASGPSWRAIAVNVSLNAGARRSRSKRRSTSSTRADLRKEIHASLTGDLARSLREAITRASASNLWQQNILYQETHRVRLLPADQWRRHRRGPQVASLLVLRGIRRSAILIEKAHQYVRVLRDVRPRVRRIPERRHELRGSDRGFEPSS